MKKTVYMIILLSLFGCNQLNDVKSVLVNIEASGEIQLVPDMAGIAVNLSCTDEDLSKSTECTKISIDELFTLLDEQNVKKDDYHSSTIYLSKEYIWRNNSQVFNGYKSSSTVNILFRNLETMSVVITKIMTMENASISNLSYSHSEMDTYANKAYLEALDNAKILADEIKEKLGGRAIEVLRVSNFREASGINEPAALRKTGERAMLASNANAPSPIQINPGAQKIIKEVYVQYRIAF